MDDAAIVAVAEAETEQTETISEAITEREETAHEAITERVQIEADAAVAIAEANADAAVAIAEAQSTEIDDTWLRSEFASLRETQALILAQMAEMAAAISALADLSTPIAEPSPLTEAETEILEPPMAEPESVAEAGPRESLEPTAPEAPKRRRRLF